MSPAVSDLCLCLPAAGLYAASTVPWEVSCTVGALAWVVIGLADRGMEGLAVVGSDSDWKWERSMDDDGRTEGLEADEGCAGLRP